MHWTRTSLIVSLCALLLAACAPQPNKTVPPEYKRGQDLFHTVCSNCHGSDALGGHTKAPNLIDAVYVKSEFSDQEIRHTINNGSGKMPSQKGKFSDEEITEIIKYLRFSQKEANLVMDAEAMDEFYDAPLPADPIEEDDVKEG
ncbi:c-type cytochrome [Nitrospina gracilis]|uniref:c-type cytochrome n=1 Tax=Nitrospina gracilis TaxID=35801 RepID=UPI001F4558E8|nr:cytochrome c [Nitrospina gracilis]MCF8720885.1 mono/diheme cytochrome c family protein [Nitrospina gracilis Nb-211]